MKRLRNPVQALLGGLALHLAFPALGYWPLAIVSVALLWTVVHATTARAGFGLSFVYFMAFFLPHLWWAYTSVGALPWVALSALESAMMSVGVAAWIHVRKSEVLGRQQLLYAAAFALMWVAAEQVRAAVPFGGFPWGRVAFSQVDSALGRLAWMGGAPLVTGMTVLVGALLGMIILLLRERSIVRTSLAAAAATAVLAAGLFVPLDVAPQAGTLVVGVAQGNVPNDGLDSFSQARQVLFNHVEATERLEAEGVLVHDLVVWPENATDIDPRVDRQTAEQVLNSVALVEAPMLIGTVDYSPPEGRYNTALVISREGVIVDSYNKQHPAPFAEYIPLRSIARQLSPEVDRVTSDMLAGTEVALVMVPIASLGRDVPVGDLICFEVAYDGLSRASINAGAEIVIVQTNNASFGLTAESEQQLAMTRLRAIETGRSAVQSSTVGVSAMIAPNGRVLSSTELFTQDWLEAELPLRTAITPAVRWGTALEWAVFILAGFLYVRAVTRLLADRWDWS